MQKISNKYLTPLVSICIPTYNGEKYLHECIASAVNQTYKNVEIIIVDDRSSDKTVSIIKEYAEKDDRIKNFLNDKNLGLVGNWNECLEKAKGVWIKFLFQDDVLDHSCIEKMFSAATENTKIVICEREFVFEKDIAPDFKEYYLTKPRLNKIINTNEIIYVKNKVIAKLAASNRAVNFIGEPTSGLFLKNIIEELGHFNKKLSQICDYEFWLRIGTIYGLTYIPEKLVKFRIHTSSTTSKNINAKKNTLSVIDPLQLTHLLLFDPVYASFRRLTGKFNIIKLRIYFKIKVYELKLLEANVTNNYPDFRKIKTNNFIQLLYKLISLKRKLIN